MIARADRPLTTRDFLQMMARHKAMLLGWIALVTTLSLLAMVLLPRQYQSEAKLLLRLGRESVTLDPTATTGPTMQIHESRETQINSTRDMLKSRALLDRVVAEVGAEPILQGPGEASEGVLAALASRASEVFSALTFMPAVSPEERAVNKLSKSIHVSLARNSSVINVGCTAKGPELSQQILETFLEAYQQQHLAANRTSGSLEFFSQQAALLKQQLDTAVEKLRDAKNESGIVSIPVEQKALQDQLTQVEANALTASASLASTDASIASLQKSMTELPEQLVQQQTTGFPNQAADYMRQEYFKQQIAAHELEAKLGADHPLVKVARRQAVQLEEVLNKQARDRTQTTNGLNSSRQTLDLELRREEALAASLRAKKSTLNEQYAALQDRLRTLNEHEVRINELDRQTQIAEANYRSYDQHLEQARIGEALEVNRISNVNVVQPPSFVERPVVPNPLVVFGLALLVMLCGSVGLTLGLEYRENSLIAAHEIPSKVTVPVLARGQQELHYH